MKLTTQTNRIAHLFEQSNTIAPPLALHKVSSSLEERLYATTDANHNVTSIDDVFGAVKERFVYDPYRNSTVLTSAFATTSDAYSFIVRSQGEREDAVTNTIDGRSRFYGLGIGRWMQADMDGYPDGANRYQFVKSNPAEFLDPMGLFGKVQGPGRVDSGEMPPLGPPVINPPQEPRGGKRNPNDEFTQLKWTGLAPVGIVHYKFEWQVLDSDSNIVRTSQVPGSGAKLTAPGEGIGLSEYYTYNSTSSPMNLLNASIGAIGEGLSGDQVAEKDAFRARNTCNGRHGWMELEVEVREARPEDIGAAGPSIERTTSQAGLNNVNRIFMGGSGIFQEPLYKNEPVGWQDGKTLSRFEARIDWNKPDPAKPGTYTGNWAEWQKSANGGSGGWTGSSVSGTFD
jgi:RHS repeat-associated protein